MIDLTGQHILITGATSPIGEAISLLASKLGATVTMLGRSQEKLRGVQMKLKGAGHENFCFDITSQDNLMKFVSDSSKFDGVVHNVGLIDYTPVKSITSKKISAVFDHNFNASVLLNSGLLKEKKLNKNSSVVFISSISASLGVPATSLYSASKAALTTYARVFASEVAASGIRSNVISPGIIITDSVQNALMEVGDLSKQEQLYPLGYGTPQDVASLSIFLLSEKSRWITGAEIKIDGGYTLN